MDIRNYILQEIKNPHSMGYSPYASSVGPAAQEVKDIAQASSSIAIEIFGLKQNVLRAQQQYDDNMLQAERELLDQAKENFEFEFARDNKDSKNYTTDMGSFDYRKFDKDLEVATRQKMDKLRKDPERLKNYLNKSTTKKSADLQKKIAKVELAGETLQVTQNALEQLYTVADTIKQRASRIKSDKKIENAREILDKVYRIKEEGEDQLQDLFKELKKMNENTFVGYRGLKNLYEGRFLRALIKIKEFFLKKALPKIDQLRREARRV